MPDEKLPADFGNIPKPAEMDVIFGRLDRNQDGKVVADEVPDGARERFDRFAVIADKNNDGAVTREEMHQAIERVREQFAGKGGNIPPAQIFEYLDRNADGKLTADEVPTERQPMFERAVRFGDRDKDGALSEEEFTTVVNQFATAAKSQEGEFADARSKSGRFSRRRFRRPSKKGGGKRPGASAARDSMQTMTEKSASPSFQTNPSSAFVRSTPTRTGFSTSRKSASLPLTGPPKWIVASQMAAPKCPAPKRPSQRFSRISELPAAQAAWPAFVSISGTRFAFPGLPANLNQAFVSSVKITKAEHEL